jgi:drug/metabolite transporter (DMT)-like permease
MRKVALVAVIVFVFAHGLRRWYSGIFFALIGAVMLVNAVRWRQIADRQNQSSG